MILEGVCHRSASQELRNTSARVHHACSSFQNYAEYAACTRNAQWSYRPPLSLSCTWQHARNFPISSFQSGCPDSKNMYFLHRAGQNYCSKRKSLATRQCSQPISDLGSDRCHCHAHLWTLPVEGVREGQAIAL